MIEELIRKAAADDGDAVEALSTIADEDPGRLAPYQGLLVDLDVLWPPKLCRTADAEVISRIIEQVDDGCPPDRLNQLLCVLAEATHPLAEQAFRRWATQPPAGADQLHVSPLDYTREGGWTIDPHGNRRDLCGDTAYQLVMRDVPRPADGRGCPWCASPLWTAVDLDTTEPAVAAALAHTGWSGRLVIETCHVCACYATLYSEVTPAGTATWWTGNTYPSYLNLDAEPLDPPTLAVPGPARANRYLASAWDRGGSTLGGRPDWIQDSEHADCPGCRQPMDYLGLIGGADLHEFGEGAYYLHLHEPCGFAAVNYQQT